MAMKNRRASLNLRKGRLFYGKGDEPMATTTLKIEGMTCDHCAHTVEKALSSVPGVNKAEVSLAQKQAVVTSEGALDFPAAARAVEEEGYQIHAS
jgi:copper chaperone CopZ